MEVGLGVSVDIRLFCNRTCTNNFWRPFKFRGPYFVMHYVAGLKAVEAGGSLV